MDPAALHYRTGGNPFFLTEILAAGSDTIPDSVRDAVLARAAHLGGAARRTLDALACVDRAPPAVVAEVCGEGPEALDECVERGLVAADGSDVAFRHELARSAVHDDIPPGRAAAWHGRALTVLQHEPAGKAGPSRLAYHAQRAGDRAALYVHARAAAHEAARLGAHPEAAGHFRSALDCAPEVPAQERAELLEGVAQQSYLSDQLEASLRAWQDAVHAWRDIGNRSQEGRALVGLSITAFLASPWVPIGMAASAQAVDALEELPPTPELALACAVRAKLAAAAYENSRAVAWAGRALALADSSQSMATALARMALGAGLTQAGDPRGLSHMAAAVDLTQDGGHPVEAGLAYFWVHHVAVSQRRFSLADEWYRRGLAFTEDEDQETWRQWLRSYRARALLEQVTGVRPRRWQAMCCVTLSSTTAAG